MTRMKVYLKSAAHSVVFLSVIHTFSVHINKYILSVLGFTYPTVFQGWQTFVTVVIMRILLFDNLTPIGWNSFRSHLPLFVCFVGSIVAGSKALSSLPIPIMIAVSNVLPAFKCLLTITHADLQNYVRIGTSILCVVSVGCIFLLDPNLSDLSPPVLWLLMHLTFIVLQFFVASGDSSLFSPLDKVFYCNLFSVVVLAPSSFYLEEAFEALHFQERRQLSFLLGCVLSGVFGTLGSVVSIYSTTGSINVTAVSKAVSCILSPMILPCSLSFSTWLLIVTILLTSCFIPQDILASKEAVDIGRSKHMEPV